MPASAKRLNLQTWLSFLETQVLTYFDNNSGLTWARHRILDDKEERQVLRWRSDEEGQNGPAPSTARAFLSCCDSSLPEYVQYCRDHHLQPWAGEQVSLDWFAGWIN